MLNTNSIYKSIYRRAYFLFAGLVILLASCSSGPFVQSKDVCALKRHYQDDIYQVTINDEVINNLYYLKEDAIEVANHLASHEINKCAPRSWP